jgi:integrase
VSSPKRWAGGLIREGRDGREVFVIEAMRQSQRYLISLGALTEKQALAELALFDRDPEGYRTAREAKAARQTSAVRLSVDLVQKFLAHLQDDSAGEARSTKYVSNTRNSLAWWAERERLGGRDLRGVTLGELQLMLDGQLGRKHKIIHLKSFCGWLRARGLLATQHDPTLELRVPQARPEKAKRPKVNDKGALEAMYAALGDQAIRDVLCLRAKTAMHHTEVHRLAKGKGELRELEDHGEIAGTCSFTHKSGRVHQVSLDAQALAAAKRLQARGGAPSDSWMLKVIKEIAKANSIKEIELGAMRHTYATMARTVGVEVKPVAAGGVPLATVAATMGHLNPRTTALFYDQTEVPPMVKLPTLRLYHPDDPVELARPATANSRSTQ